MRTARALLAVVAVSLGAAALAHAASLVFADGGVGAGSAPVDPCTTAGLGVVGNLSGVNIVSVTVSGLPPSCGNATVMVTVNNGLTTGSGSSTVPAGGGAVTVSLDIATAVATRVQTDLVLVGP